MNEFFVGVASKDCILFLYTSVVIEVMRYLNSISSITCRNWRLKMLLFLEHFRVVIIFFTFTVIAYHYTLFIFDWSCLRSQPSTILWKSVFIFESLHTWEWQDLLKLEPLFLLWEAVLFLFNMFLHSSAMLFCFEKCYYSFLACSCILRQCSSTLGEKIPASLVMSVTGNSTSMFSF